MKILDRERHGKRALLSASIVFVMAAPGIAAEVIPVYNVTFMGGQYFFQSTRSNLNGNASVVAAPVVKTSERWAFIPTYSGNYRGTKGVGESVGAGTLFQQQMDHRLGFSALRTLEDSKWRLKPSLSYKREFLKETRDEAWGHGLFDYEKIAVGFETENVYREPFSYRMGLDIYRIRFPNYQSLESKSGVDPQGNPLGRELANKNVLDTYNFALSASATRPFPYEEPVVALQASYSFLFQNYSDQNLIDLRGQIVDGGRRDYLQTLAAGVGYPRPVRLWGSDYRLDSNFGVNLAYNGSNQNTFDASRTQFVPDSYSYYSFGLGPAWSLGWGDSKNPTSVGVSLRYSRIQYRGRLAQDGEGLYTADHQYQDRFLLGLNYGYPIAPGFKLRAQANFLWARSNNRYEKTYAYNYRTANYLMGFTYEY